MPTSSIAATPPGLIEIVTKFVHAVSGTDGAAFAALFVPDASITDTLSPYHWQGKGAATAYFTDLQATVGAVGWTGLHLVGNGEPFVVSGRSVAYASVPLAVDYTAKGVAHEDKGVFTLSLKQDGKAWLINSATWTYTQPPS